MAAEALLDGEAEALTRKALDMAQAGDVTALRLCLERLIPPRRDRPLSFSLPSIADPRDHPAALCAILGAVSEGALTPSEAEALGRLLAEHRRAIETADLAARIEALEKAL